MGVMIEEAFRNEMLRKAKARRRGKYEMIYGARLTLICIRHSVQIFLPSALRLDAATGWCEPAELILSSRSVSGFNPGRLRAFLPAVLQCGTGAAGG